MPKTFRGGGGTSAELGQRVLRSLDHFRMGLEGKVAGSTKIKIPLAVDYGFRPGTRFHDELVIGPDELGGQLLRTQTQCGQATDRCLQETSAICHFSLQNNATTSRIGPLRNANFVVLARSYIVYIIQCKVVKRFLPTLIIPGGK